MKYAIFSDIHGNFPALTAALDDARAQGADAYLMLGDYIRDLQWNNEVIETIRNLSSATVIRGNGEGYLYDLQRQDQSQWVYEQLKPIYWCYRDLSPENIKYLTTLPETAVITDEGENIRLSHSLKLFYRSPKIQFFHSLGFRTVMEQMPFSHEEYLVLARKALLSNSEALSEIQAMPEGVYLFGHNHMQFHMEYAGRLFINPGSCGDAMDFDPTAAYTLIERVGVGWKVTERRVAYDIDMAAGKLTASGFTAYAPMWTSVIKLSVMTGKDYFSSFLLHIEETARKLGRPGFPVDNDVWEIAVETWDEDKVY